MEREREEGQKENRKQGRMKRVVRLKGKKKERGKTKIEQNKRERRGKTNNKK